MSNVDELLALSRLSLSLAGKSILDIGTNNGGFCFEAERRGATDILGVDVAPETLWGFEETRAFLGSKARYKRATLYELPGRIEARDVVFCFGVLYHLRHPLLGLDALRSITREYAIIETAVSDREGAEGNEVRFYRGNELNNDGSNWFAPSVDCLLAWCWSAGFKPELLSAWPEKGRPQRAMVRARPVPGLPEYVHISYDRPLTVTPRSLWMDSF